MLKSGMLLWSFMVDSEDRTRGQGSIIKVKCSMDKEINKRLR